MSRIKDCYGVEFFIEEVTNAYVAFDKKNDLNQLIQLATENKYNYENSAAYVAELTFKKEEEFKLETRLQSLKVSFGLTNKQIKGKKANFIASSPELKFLDDIDSKTFKNRVQHIIPIRILENANSIKIYLIFLISNDLRRDEKRFVTLYLRPTPTQQWQKDSKRNLDINPTKIKLTLNKSLSLLNVDADQSQASDEVGKIITNALARIKGGG